MDARVFALLRPGMTKMGICQLCRAALALIRTWRERARGRAELARLCGSGFRTECDLKDLGISRTEALQEAMKPFWRG